MPRRIPASFFTRYLAMGILWRRLSLNLCGMDLISRGRPVTVPPQPVNLANPLRLQPVVPVIQPVVYSRTNAIETSIRDGGAMMPSHFVKVCDPPTTCGCPQGIFLKGSVSWNRCTSIFGNASLRKASMEGSSTRTSRCGAVTAIPWDKPRFAAWPTERPPARGSEAVRYRAGERTIVQRTKITDNLGEILKKLGVSIPQQILSISEPVAAPAAT